MHNTMNEPLLTSEDERIWALWKKTCLIHARTRSFMQRLKKTEHIIAEMHRICPQAYIAWSAGKDSTVLTHFITQCCGVPARAMSVKDDMDFPGETEYVHSRAEDWNIIVDILTPSFSLEAWLERNSARIYMGDDLHGRNTEFSAQGFYSLIERYNEERGWPGVYLGIRREESVHREKNYAVRGHIYEKKSGDIICQPLALWSEKDVYAYAFVNDIELLPVYQCVRLSKTPGSIRKSWYIPGTSAKHGQVVWLRTYYPSLYEKLCEILPETRRMT